jgi:hypothetical protein
MTFGRVRWALGSALALVCATASARRTSPKQQRPSQYGM